MFFKETVRKSAAKPIPGSTHVTVTDPGGALILRDVPVRGTLEQPVGPVLLLLDRRHTLAAQRLVALPQAQQRLAAPQLLRDLLQKTVPPERPPPPHPGNRSYVM